METVLWMAASSSESMEFVISTLVNSLGIQPVGCEVSVILDYWAGSFNHLYFGNPDLPDQFQYLTS